MVFLIRYFDTFPAFEQNNSSPICEEFDRLAIHQQWTRNSEIWREQFLRCWTEEFTYFCGDL